MDVLELLNHYRLEKLNDKENELFTYFAYSYAIENDENNHPSFRISLFSKISRIAVLDFLISYKGQISYACQICRDKQPCYHFSILVTKLLNDEYEQIKALSERFNYEVGDVDRREQQAAFDYELKQVFEEIRKEDIANASTKARLKIYLEDTRFSYSVNLTIAKGKEYRIASIDRFLNRFINEEEFRYGKDLTIVHRLSSFDETSQKIIKILRKVEQNSFIDLNNESSLQYLDALLNALKDDYLYINNEVYHVEKETMDIKIVANDNYSLSVQGLIKGYIPLTRNYYICKSANSVKPLTNNKYINYLIDSTINYPLSTVRENFDNFKYSFFEKYPEYFILSDEIKQLMNTSSLRIEAYFDYDKAGRPFYDEFYHLLDHTCTSYHCSWTSGPVPKPLYEVHNDKTCAALAEKAITASLGNDILTKCEPWMASETFAILTRLYPGVLTFTGIANPSKGTGGNHHTPEFDLDEDALVYGTTACISYALAFLKENPQTSFIRTNEPLDTLAARNV